MPLKLRYPPILCSAIVAITLLNYASTSETFAERSAGDRTRMTAIKADRIFEGEKIINYFSVFTKEPEDAADIQHIPDTNQSGYSFPIKLIKRYEDSTGKIRLQGTIFLRGNASHAALPLLNKFFSDSGGLSSRGTTYLVKIRFEPAATHAKTEETLEINWLSKTELANYAGEENIKNISVDSKMVVGLTQLGSNTAKINPVYENARSMKLAFANWPITSRQLREIIKHSRGVYAHELTHAMGLSHMRNHTKSIVSYASGRFLTGDDARAICLLVTNNDQSLCPE